MTGNGNHTTYKNGDDWGMVQMALGTTPIQGFGSSWQQFRAVWQA